MNPAIVYTETLVFSAPEQFLADAPYQIAIVDQEAGPRITVRVLTDSIDARVKIGDRLIFVQEKDGVVYYRKLDN